MYTPRSFRVEDLPTLHELIRRYSFGTLISHDGSRTVATHLPFMIDASRGPNGTLIAHMARANPQWKSWAEDTEVLAIFQGPHAYVTPDWYEDKETVPTWNYATVHAYGRPDVVHDPEALRPMVDALVDLHESAAQSDWDPALMEGVMHSELQAIVGFEIPIASIEGKFKYNQNRSRADQEGVATALERSSDALEAEAGAIMRRNLHGQSPK